MPVKSVDLTCHWRPLHVDFRISLRPAWALNSICKQFESCALLGCANFPLPHFHDRQTHDLPSVGQHFLRHARSSTCALRFPSVYLPLRPSWYSWSIGLVCAVWSGIYAVIGFASFCLSIAQQGLFTLMGQKLTRRMRKLMFAAALNQVAFDPTLQTALSGLCLEDVILNWLAHGSVERAALLFMSCLICPSANDAKD